MSTSAAFLKKLRRIRSCSAFFCFLGIALSCYALYVEIKKEQDDSYVAMCDFNEKMSCTKVFSSKYDKCFPFHYSHNILTSYLYLQVWKRVWIVTIFC